MIRTDYAIYMAAGADELLKERQKIGDMETGQAAVTPAIIRAPVEGLRKMSLPMRPMG